jgi:hypothetical protein
LPLSYYKLAPSKENCSIDVSLQKKECLQGSLYAYVDWFTKRKEKHETNYFNLPSKVVYFPEGLKKNV